MQIEIAGSAERLLQVIDTYGHVKRWVLEEVLLAQDFTKPRIDFLLATLLKEGKLKESLVCKLHHDTPCYSRKY